MKKIDSKIKKNPFKKIFIKICRIFGFEIIDQSNYEVPTLNKSLDENLSIPGKKSITVPLGQIKITRKIKSLKVIFRSNTSELIMGQNKKRIFDASKNQYTFRSLNSLLKSLTQAKKIFDKINFEIVVTVSNSEKADLDQIEKILSKYQIKNRLISIKLEDFKNKIASNCTAGQFSNMANFYTSLNLAKNESEDLIYFVEDDYLHTEAAILEMLFTYEKFSSIFENEIFLVPADYPYLYTKNISTKIFFGHQKHWRLIDESLATFMTSKEVVLNNLEKLLSMGKRWGDPWEEPLHEIYKKNPCFSPIPSLSVHCANINSSYGLPPNLDWKKIWEENDNY